MPVIHYHAPLRALVAVRGHPFDRSAFDAMFQAMPGISATMVDQPAAALLMNPEGMREFDVLVLYDMPGLDFEAAPRPGIITPSPALQAGFRALLEQGKGVVALHHALAGWPDWSEYHDWLGGQFLYRPATLRGRACRDSGYRHDVPIPQRPAPIRSPKASPTASRSLTNSTSPKCSRTRLSRCCPATPARTATTIGPPRRRWTGGCSPMMAGITHPDRI